MQELIIAIVLLGLALTAVLVSWLGGKRAGAESQELKDKLEHETKTLAALEAQKQIDAKTEKFIAEVKSEPYYPLSQAEVDKLLKKYKDLD